MANSNIVVSADAQGQYHLPNVARADIAKVDIVDVDIILATKSGDHYVLPGAGIAAMGSNPPAAIFADTSVGSDQLLSEVGSAVDLSEKVPSPASTTPHSDAAALKAIQAQVKTLEAKLKQTVAHEKAVEAKAHEHDATSQPHPSNVAALTVNTESSVETIVQEAQKIMDDVHNHDFEFVPVRPFVPPSSSVSAPPGEQAPLSLTPLVTLFMGNVVNTIVDSTTTPGVTYIYGGGGAIGSDSSVEMGPHNPLQFSPATITGTSGNDVIYAEGAVAGNGNAHTYLYAKEFILNVAGYFTTLNNVVFSGVPAGVSITGATHNADGTWTLPSSAVLKQNAFTLVYDSTAASSTGSFDIQVTVSGETTRHAEFSTTQNFRFQYEAVTSVNQITDPTLVYDYKGQLREVYVLPTQDQPNIINSGDGNDTIYGGRNNDTITSGAGNNVIFGANGNDIITTGNGNNAVSVGSGNNAITTGSGNDTITAAGGNNVINAGDGLNVLSLGDGANMIQTGSGADTITAGNGNNILNDTGGDNQVTVGGGANQITFTDGNNSITTGNGANSITVGTGTNTIHTGAGNDTIIAGNGTNTIVDTGGNNTITTGSGNDSITTANGNNLIHAGDGANAVHVGDGANTIFGGAGNDSFYGGNGNNVFKASLGTDVITAGSGSNAVDFTTVTGLALNITLASGVGTAIATGMSDTLTNIGIIYGNDAGDTITGSGSYAYQFIGGAGADSITGGSLANTIYGGDGNDTLVGGVGNDYIYGGAGNNSIYGGSAGVDYLYGGSGNNTFLSPHAGTHYDGTNGANLVVGQVNAIDYSADPANLTINLLAGTGIGGTADGSSYAFTPASGSNSINEIIGGSGSNVIIGSNSDDYLVASTGGTSTDSLTGGLGNNTLVHGTTTGTVSYFMGGGHDTIIASATNSNDLLLYQGSPSGLVINMDSISHNFLNSAGVTETVAAFSGSNFGVTTADANSYSNGDYYTPVSGNLTGIDSVQGSSFADLVFGGATFLAYYNTSGGNDTMQAGSGGAAFFGYSQNDMFYGGSAGTDFYAFSAGNDRAVGGAGFNVLRSTTFYTSDYNVVTYLDGTMDVNGNGIADYIDRKINGNSLVSNGVSYSGFEVGFQNAADGSGSFGSTLFNNFENVLGNTANDFIVGDNSANQINARGGINTIYGMGGNDTITAIEGSNTIDGGAGTDMINFQWASSTQSGNGNITSASALNTFGVRVFFADANFTGTGSDQSHYYGDSTHSAFQAQTGTTGQFLYSQIVNVENINGSDYTDVLYGNSSANAIYGQAGADTIAGNGGADSLYGGNDNDIIIETAASMATVAVIDGGAGTDTLQAAGWTFAANSFTSAKFNAIEVIDVRNSASGGTYGLSSADIVNISTHVSGTAAVTLKLDTGDTFTASPASGGQVVMATGETVGVGDNMYHYYATTGHTYTDTGFTASLTVHYGAG